MFFKSVDQRNGELPVDVLLFCHNDQSAKVIKIRNFKSHTDSVNNLRKIVVSQINGENT